ncbi:MAG: hypothetical protein C0413_05850 [Clostridiales bacterium]|nr:hypothetical protein [Clostridiales bacterium]
MPYNFTHALVGLTALQQANEAVANLARRYRAEFLIGTMGPDPYFGDDMPKPLFRQSGQILAEKLHALDGRALLAAMLPLADSEPKQAYVIGFLCHFLLDNIAHPYIEARFYGSAHSPSEIQIDLMMTDRIAFAGVPEKPRKFYRTRHLRGLDELHTQMSKALFDQKTSGVFARGFRKWIFINSISYDPNNRKLQFFSGIERVLRIPGKLTTFLVARHPDPDDRLNLNRAEWRAPWESEIAKTESFPNLFSRACAEAPALMNAALAAMQGGDNTEAINLISARRMDARPL